MRLTRRMSRTGNSSLKSSVTNGSCSCSDPPDKLLKDVVHRHAPVYHVLALPQIEQEP